MIKRATQSLLGSAAAAVDRMATAYATAGRRRNRAESLSHLERMTALEQLAELYTPFEGNGLFRPARPIVPEWQRIRRLEDGGDVLDLRWPSDYQTLISELDDRYHRHVANHRAAARVWLHPEPRSAIVLIHGYMAGHHAFEERAWPTSWLYRIGLDIALFVLPFHGVRARGKSGPPAFPAADPRITIEGFRQTMADLRDLFGWLEARGCPSAGAMGMSLGGYTSALAATVHDELAFVIPVIPLASIADFARDHGRLGSGSDEGALEHAALEKVYRLVSPLHRAPVLDPERVLVIGAEHDRITHITQAERLAAHFGVPLTSWQGGHLLQLWRTPAFRRVGRFLGDLGVLPPRA
jgi:pimeloyl-ACP methyl ester carboxylesterase